MSPLTTEDRLLTSAEVARLFGVNTRTVWRWASDGLIASLRTPGGHLRFRRADIHVLLAEGDL